jgi:hypothetical protein
LGTGEQLQQGGFTGARRANNGQLLSTRKRKTYAIQSIWRRCHSRWVARRAGM